MAFLKCPRCELNYILDGGALCTVCRREVRGEPVDEEISEMCSECGENPAAPGSEYCAQCLKDINRRTSAAAGTSDETITVEDATLGMDNVSGMDEIVINDGEESEESFDEDDDEFQDDEDSDEGIVSPKAKSMRIADDMIGDMEESLPDDEDDDLLGDDEDEDDDDLRDS